MKSNLNKNTILSKINANAEKMKIYGVKKIGLFGSYLKGKATSKSDIDLLVSFEKPTFDSYMGLKEMLEKEFGRKVDLVIEENLKLPLNYVKKEAVYAKGG